MNNDAIKETIAAATEGMNFSHFAITEAKDGRPMIYFFSNDAGGTKEMYRARFQAARALQNAGIRCFKAKWGKYDSKCVYFNDPNPTNARILKGYKCAFFIGEK